MEGLEKRVENIPSGNGVGVRVYGNNVGAALKRFKRTLDRQGRTGEMIEIYCNDGISGKKLSPFLGPARYGKPFRNRQQRDAEDSREY